MARTAPAATSGCSLTSRSVVASAGTALLVWAGCPVLGFPLAEAHRQKVFSIRVGIVLSLSGLVFAGGVALLAAA